MLQLVGAREPVAALSAAIDTIRNEAPAAVRELRDGIAAEQRRTERTVFRRCFHQEIAEGHGIGTL